MKRKKSLRRGIASIRSARKAVRGEQNRKLSGQFPRALPLGDWQSMPIVSSLISYFKRRRTEKRRLTPRHPMGLGVRRLTSEPLEARCLLATYLVDHTGLDGHYATIQAAINVATDNDIIEIAAGQYHEHLTIDNKSLTLEGDGAIGDGVTQGTLLPGDGVNVGISISGVGKTVTIAGLGISDWYQGVAVSAATLHLDNCVVTTSEIYGVQVNNAGNVYITDSNITHNGAAGVAAGDASTSGYAEISNSDLTGNAHGLLAFSTGTAKVSGSDLSGYAAEKAVVNNNTTAVVDASGCYWGNAISDSGILGQISGEVDFTPYLKRALSTQPDTGFAGDFSELYVTTIGAQSGSTGRIQEGVDLIADGLLTGGARKVNVNDGLYHDANIAITQAMTIEGQSQGGVILGPSMADDHEDSSFGGNYSYAFLLQSGGVTIQDLTIDGNEDGSIAGDHNFRGGIMTDHRLGLMYDNITVQDVTVEHTYRWGIQIFTGLATQSTGHLIKDNTIDDVMLGPGIALFDAAADVTGNHISNVDSAIQMVEWSASGGTEVHIEDNIIFGVSGVDGAIQVVVPAGGTTIHHNQITLSGTGGVGIIVRNATGEVTVDENTVSGTGGDAGIWMFGNAIAVAVHHNILTATGSTAGDAGTGVGIFLSDDGRLFLDGNGEAVSDLPTYATLTGNEISGFATGVYLYRNGIAPAAGGQTIDVTLGGTNPGDSNTITGGGTGVLVFDANGTTGANAVINIAGNVGSIHGNEIGIDVEGGTATITANNIYDNGIGILVTTYNGGGAQANIVGNHIYGNDTGVKVGYDAGDTSAVTIDGNVFHGSGGNTIGVNITGGSTIIENNDLSGNDLIGIAIFGGSTKIENNNLAGNGTGIVLGGDAVVDVGGGSLGSLGLNTLTGYTGNPLAGSYAIMDLNFVPPLGMGIDVSARYNNFGPYVDPSIIENFIYDNTDDTGVTNIDTSGALNQQPAPSTVYVDDNWAGLALGVDPDGIAGPATAMGVDAFATITEGVNTVTAYSGTASRKVNVNDGLYHDANIAITQAMTIEGQSQGGVILGPSMADDHEDSSFGGNYSYAFLLQSGGVTIQDLTIDGNEDGSIAGDHNFRGGIMTDHRLGLMYDNITVQDVTVEHTYRWGIQIFTGLATQSTGHLIKDNTIDDVMLGPGIALFDAAADVTGNHISNVDSAIQMVEWSASGGTEVHIEDNIIFGVSGVDGAIQVVVPAGGTTIHHNQITLSGTGGVGIIVRNATGEVTVDENTVSGTGGDAGIWMFGNAIAVAVHHNILTATGSTAGDAGTGVGIFLSDDGRLFLDGNGEAVSDLPTYATLTGNEISGFATGVYLYRNGLTGQMVQATIGGDASGVGNLIAGNGAGTGICVFDADGVSNGRLAVATIVGNKASIILNDIGIDVDGGSATLTNNDIFGNVTGVRAIHDGTVSLDGNLFEGTLPSGSFNIFDDATPEGNANDGNAIQLGTVFRSIVDGTVTGVRFYKDVLNTGTHTGSLWIGGSGPDAGTLLATLTFTGETASGWQTATFATPVHIQANKTYVVSYYSPTGEYAYTHTYFQSHSIDNGPLQALQDGIDGHNGLYIYGADGVYPDGAFESSNYWVDAMFTAETTVNNTTDLLVDGTAGTVTVGSNNAFAGGQYYINNQSSQDIAALKTAGNTFTAPDNFRIEDKMLHKVDDLSKGLITWVDGNVYITKDGTDHSINQGITVASPDWTVNVEAGTYHERLTIGKPLTLLGAQAGVDPTASGAQPIRPTSRSSTWLAYPWPIRT